jgi:hypothetical protein
MNSPHCMQLEVHYHLLRQLLPSLSHFSLCEYLFVSTAVFVKI